MNIDKVDIKFRINGKLQHFNTYPMARLLDVIRSDAKLTGTKEGCGEGECGACSIFINGEITNSCLVPACQAQGADIQTIEGLANKDTLNHIQDAFLKYGGAQCGICTPGMIIAATNLLKKYPNPNEEEIKEGLAGNLCRCTGYTKIFESVVKAIGGEQ